MVAMNRANIPKHVAIIMDGNRRWAKKKNKPSSYGHQQGAQVVNEVVEAAAEMGIETLTLFAFSTENWNRSRLEVATIHNILELSLKKMCRQMVANGVRFDTIGDISQFRPSLQKAIQEVKEATQENDRINLVLALNYGGRDEIRRAAIKACEKLQSPAQLTEKMISQELDTARFGDPEMIIRPSGENRLSNFLLWQAQYAEIISLPILWPDFSRDYLRESVKEYQQRQRRLGE